MPRLFCYALNDLITTLHAASSTFSLLLAYCLAQLHSASGLVSHFTADIYSSFLVSIHMSLVAIYDRCHSCTLIIHVFGKFHF